MYKVLIKTAYCQYVRLSIIFRSHRNVIILWRQIRTGGALILNKQTKNKSVKNLAWSFFPNCVRQRCYQIACWLWAEEKRKWWSEWKLQFPAPIALQDGATMRHFPLATSVSIHHLLLNWFAREDVSLSSDTVWVFFITTTKPIR